jgi:type IV secretory pathway TraG/TraD family ATPase VirD4
MNILDKIISSLLPEKKANESLHGSAEWGTDKEFNNLFKPDNKGLVINGSDQISVKNSFLHSAIIAPSGAGKTTSYIIPNIAFLNGSAVITDPSGEIYNYTSEYLKNRGFETATLNPNDLKNSDFFNPLQRINNISDINKIVSVLIDNAFQDSKGDDFWNNGAKDILILIIKAVKTLPKESQNLGQARNFLLLYGQLDQSGEIDQLAEKLSQLLNNQPREQAEILSFFANDQKVLDNFITTAKSALTVFTDENITAITSKDTINFERLKQSNKSLVIFLIVPEHEINYYSFLLNLFYTQVFNFCLTSSEKKPVFFLLDEFGNMGKIPNFESIITTLRKRNCSISIILQDKKQLAKLYGENGANTIFGNCANKIFFAGMSGSMCQEVEQLLGNSTVEHTDQETERNTLHRRPLLTADEIRRIEQGEIIYLFKNTAPFLLKNAYFDMSLPIGDEAFKY